MTSLNAARVAVCVYSEPEIEGGRFAIGLVPRPLFDEVRHDYLEPILVERFPLRLLHPDSVVRLVLEAPLAEILRRRPAPGGEFIAVLPRRVSVEREDWEFVLRSAGFAPVDGQVWRLGVDS